MLSTIITPIAFRKKLHDLLSKRDHCDIRRFTIRVQGHHHTGVLHEVCDALHHLDLDVIEAHIESDGAVGVL